MTTLRTFKFFGKAYSTEGAVAVTAAFNGKEVFSGEIPTEDETAPIEPQSKTLDELFVCQDDIAVTGNVPLVLTVSNGVLFFGAVAANFRGIEVDILELDNGETGDPVIIVPPESVWGDVNTKSFESDGKLNVTVDDVPQVRQVLDLLQTGDWQYRIPSGSTFSCDIFVDPDLIVTEWVDPE